MAERLSTGHVNSTLDKFREDYANGVLEIYSGTQPGSADDAETGDLLCVITQGGGAFTAGEANNGLNFGVPNNGTIDKDTTETWSGKVLKTGTAGWFRFYDNSYTKGATTTAKRFDGAISTSSSAELQMLNTFLTADGQLALANFPVTAPKA